MLMLFALFMTFSCVILLPICYKTCSIVARNIILRSNAEQNDSEWWSVYLLLILTCNVYYRLQCFLFEFTGTTKNIKSCELHIVWSCYRKPKILYVTFIKQTCQKFLKIFCSAQGDEKNSKHFCFLFSLKCISFLRKI